MLQPSLNAVAIPRGQLVSYAALEDLGVQHHRGLPQEIPWAETSCRTTRRTESICHGVSDRGQVLDNVVSAIEAVMRCTWTAGGSRRALLVLRGEPGHFTTREISYVFYVS
jgi:hypothetical protein